MPFEMPQFDNIPKIGEDVRSERLRLAKEMVWENKRKDIEEDADAEGYAVDEGIKEDLVAFNIMNLPTMASCEGHADHGRGAPWVEISAPNQPEERFVGERAIFEKVAAKYNVPVEQLMRDDNKEARSEALTAACQNEETPAYRKWRTATEEMMGRTKNLLGEFYNGREVAPALRLEIEEGAEGEFRVHNGGADYRDIPHDLSDNERRALLERLLEYRQEMDGFSGFLHDKFFSEQK
jgi:hypothetical protein